MKKVYKYFHRRYKIAIAMGFFYVNTFNTIRNQYENGQISDQTEGVTENLSGNLLIDDSSHPKHQQAIQDLKNLGAINISGDCKNISIVDCSFGTTVRDAYMFCVTEERNDEYWKNLSLSQGGSYDCCIEISDFIDFARRLQMACTNQYRLYGQSLINRCFYEGNRGVISEGTTKLPDYFRKLDQEGFKIQKEMRVVIVPQQPSLLIPRTVYFDTTNLVKIIL